MFEWRIEDLKLLEEAKILTKINPIFSCESTTSREDKIAFVDKMQDGKLSYILDLQEKFKRDSEALPKDQYGNVKTISLKAWIKKNDIKQFADNTYHYGEIYICGVTTLVQSDKGGYRLCDNLVDKVFHRQIGECLKQERVYFKTHDKYEVLKTLLKEKMDKLNTTFGVRITTSSDDSIKVNNRPITADEIKDLLGKYEKLENYIKKLTDNTHIE